MKTFSANAYCALRLVRRKVSCRPKLVSVQSTNCEKFGRAHVNSTLPIRKIFGGRKIQLSQPSRRYLDSNWARSKKRRKKTRPAIQYSSVHRIHKPLLQYSRSIPISLVAVPIRSSNRSPRSNGNVLILFLTCYRYVH